MKKTNKMKLHTLLLTVNKMLQLQHLGNIVFVDENVKQQ